jgi:hypothetical protein
MAWNKGLTKEDERVMKYVQKKIGIKRTLEQRKKMSDSHRGVKLSKEHSKKIGLGHRGLKFSTGIKFDESLMSPEKIKHNGYIWIRAPKHSKSNKQGYIYEHRLIMEKHIGRELLSNEVVHHINNIRNDNRIENLQLFLGNGKHLNHSLKSIKSIGRLNNGQN